MVVSVKAYHCANHDAPSDEQNGFCNPSVNNSIKFSELWCEKLTLTTTEQGNNTTKYSPPLIDSNGSHEVVHQGRRLPLVGDGGSWTRCLHSLPDTDKHVAVVLE